MPQRLFRDRKIQEDHYPAVTFGGFSWFYIRYVQRCWLKKKTKCPQWTDRLVDRVMVFVPNTFSLLVCYPLPISILVSLPFFTSEFLLRMIVAPLFFSLVWVLLILIRWFLRFNPFSSSWAVCCSVHFTVRLLLRQSPASSPCLTVARVYSAARVPCQWPGCIVRLDLKAVLRRRG